jgi:hypothetical protein
VGGDGARRQIGRGIWETRLVRKNSIRCSSVKAEGVRLLVLPLVVSISFFLIADIDRPRGGVIHVNPQNLASLVESLRAR